MNIETISFNSAKDFLAYLDPKTGNWGNEWNNTWIYRGQWDSRWGLVPSAWRKLQDIFKPFISKYENEVKGFWKDHRAKWEANNAYVYSNDVFMSAIRNNNEDKVVQSILTNACEHRVLKDFIWVAKDLGFPIDYDRLDDWSINRHLYRGGPGRTTWAHYSVDYTMVSLAQHHGVPTRILDWTKNPIKAAYFAIHNQLNEKSNPEKIAVWALNSNFERPDNSSGLHHLNILPVLRYKNEYLHAQDGTFTIIDEADHWYWSKGEWPTTEKAIETSIKDPEKKFRKIELAFNQVGELRKLLWNERISKAHMMRTYDNITEALRANWRDPSFDI